MDKENRMCYYVTKILTLSQKLRERCEYGFLPQIVLGLYFHCRAAFRVTAIFIWEGKPMETRVAVMSIIVENSAMTERLNAILHEHGEYIIGRMGIPYRKRKICIISIALDAPQNTIAALAGKIGSLEGISVKTAYSAKIYDGGEENENS